MTIVRFNPTHRGYSVYCVAQFPSERPMLSFWDVLQYNMFRICQLWGRKDIVCR